MKKNTKNKFGGTLVENYEVLYCKFKKAWQVWHPEYGFLATYRDKNKAIEYCRSLLSNSI